MVIRNMEAAGMNQIRDIFTAIVTQFAKSANDLTIKVDQQMCIELR